MEVAPTPHIVRRTGDTLSSPAHLYALLRILFGLLGCMFLFGLSDTATFWEPGGLVPMPASGWKHALEAQGLASMVGRALFFANVVAAVLMTIGYRSSASVAASFILSVTQGYWNPLPLSGAFEVRSAVLFGLMWADTGRVWSVDARRAQPPSLPAELPSMWPLYLVRCQIAIVYFSTGLWKLGSDLWRYGTALHYVLNNNGFARWPSLPEAAVSVLIVGTYVTLFWELLFPALVAFRRTRWIALGLGIVLHLGMWLTMELGPFPWVMLASYVSYAQPATIVRIAGRFQSAARPSQQTEVA